MIRIVGDINLTDGYFYIGHGIGTSIKNGADPFEGFQRKDDDFWIGNFECVCSSVSNKTGLEKEQFRIRPEFLKDIKHLNLYGVANNHVMQHGAEAYNEMLSYLTNSNVGFCGSKEKKTCVFDYEGKHVSITAFSQHYDVFSPLPLYWYMPDYCQIQEEVNRLSNIDYKIAYVHWGSEFVEFPYEDQKQFARFLIDSGFDLVIGMHPHRLQGFEIYKGHYIFYSLGNCVFNMAWEPCLFSIVVNLDVLSKTVSYDYLKLNTNGFPEYIRDVPKEYALDTLNAIIGKTLENEEYYNIVRNRISEYQKVNRLYFIKNLHKMPYSAKKQLIKGFINRRIFKK